ncbi:CPBP family intramembrane glutamic endopeptidase [Actinoplanes couchii]|uniref:Abortive infection protein n=1 Tax=Actinoplanes couchii TaxID=403638 RepID=A0ABQ3X262_9ACTN|nr:type II CAAX endopeptidase family protein [Actinoplanes couchii]MDR6316994.1 membrane protease YdiL (CAAX protease family) [Actinoplanes couchii]GID52602.1 putative abortive infection protein [Actinoplanes couchii]
MTDLATAPPSTVRTRPGLPELFTGVIAYVVLLIPGALWIASIPAGTAFSGTAAFIVSGLTGIGAFAVAAAIRIRRLDAFGFRRTQPKWLLIGAAFGLLAYLANILVAGTYTLIAGHDNPQGGYQAAATGGALTLVIALLTGALLTPLGEELLFRGVIANALNRYGWWAGVLLSAAIFALAHGINVILPVAFLVGVLSAILFRRTGSIWPSVLVHVVNNGVSTLVAAVVLG